METSEASFQHGPAVRDQPQPVLFGHGTLWCMRPLSSLLLSNDIWIYTLLGCAGCRPSWVLAKRPGDMGRQGAEGKLQPVPGSCVCYREGLRILQVLVPLLCSNPSEKTHLKSMYAPQRPDPPVPLCPASHQIEEAES